jgi:hypothetical protein
MMKSRSLAELFIGPVSQFNFLQRAGVRLARLQFRPCTFYRKLKSNTQCQVCG